MTRALQRRALILFLLFIILLILPKIIEAQQVTSATNKIYSIVLSTIDRMRTEGITAKNAVSMNVQKKYSSNVVPFDAYGRIGLLVVVKETSPQLTGIIKQMGGEVEFISADWKNISVYMPIDQVENLANNDEVLIVRPLMGGITNTGSVTSEGDNIHHAVNVRTDLNVKGDSINIGVISDGCTSWAQSQALGDLPPGFGPPNFLFANGPKIGSGDEGTAMMEIVYDLAPNASIYFYGAMGIGGGMPTMVDAIQRLVREKGCKVIVDDLTYWGEPMFEDGTVATQGFVAAAAKWAIDTGVVYISSAGNWAQGGLTDRSHYQRVYLDINGLTPVPPPPAGPKIALPNGPIRVPFPPPFDNLNDFGNGITDVGLQIITPAISEANSENLVVVLQWPNPWQGSNDDYDLYLYDKNLNFKIAQSITVQDGTAPQDPYEIISLTHDAVRETLNIVINHYSKVGAGPDALLDLYIYDCLKVEYNTPQNSIWGHPGVPGVIAVGAVPYNNITNIEPYSSIGNYDVYFPAFASRPKPDVIAVDGVQITGVGPFPPQGGGRFWGTSAAAPHVAAMAGLLLSKCPTMTPAQVQSKFERTAVDLGGVGFDSIYGYGRADIQRAMLEVDTAVGHTNQYTLNNTVNVPMFYATGDGYAMNTVTVTGGLNQPTSVSSRVSVTSVSPYADALVQELYCPTVNRWFQLTPTGGTSGGYNTTLTAYIDESERSATGVSINNLRILHYNGGFFDILPQAAAPQQIRNTWVIKANYNNASLSPFFIAYLTRGVDVAGKNGNTGYPDSTVPVTFSVQNTGNGWDTMAFHARDSRGWTLSPKDSSFSLGPSTLADMNINVKISSSDSVGTIDTIWLISKSVSDTTLKDSAFVTVKIIPPVFVLSCHYMEGWNMVSVPVRVGVDSCRKSYLYPTASGPAFIYSGGYVPVHDSLEYGWGFWIKLDSARDISYRGQLLTIDTIGVVTAWNMIGSITNALDVDSIIQIPDSIVTSRYYGYNGNYFIADSIQPGQAYWVRTKQAGKLVLKISSSPSIPPQIKKTNPFASFSSLTFSSQRGKTQTLYFAPDEMISSKLQKYDLPPLPPAGSFDLRFASQRFVEGYTTGNQQTTLAITIMPTSDPLHLAWNIADKKISASLTDENGRRYEMPSNGATILPSGIQRLSLIVQPLLAEQIAKKFSLEQNSPNPFNPSTSIRFTLPSPAIVTLVVRNTLGQEIARPLDQIQLEAGEHTTDFDAASLPSGVYFYTITTLNSSFGRLSQNICTKKMLLLK
jgi:hypothetical protein